MERKTTETAPAWLIALAASALSLSWAVTRNTAPEEPTRSMPAPSRLATSAPLDWPMLRLPPIAAAEMPAYRTEAGLSLRLAGEPGRTIVIAPPRISVFESVPPIDDRLLWRVSEVDRLVTQPLSRAGADGPRGYRLVILAPTTPLRKAGDTGGFIVTRRHRIDWSVFGADTLAIAEQAGRLVGRVASRPSVDRASLSTPSRSLLITSRDAADRRRVAHRPVTPLVVKTIADYLARAPRSAATPAPTALGEQLDRVARSAESAPWAWAVAYRLRTLASTAASDADALRASLASLSKTAAEAAKLADGAGDPASATELRRARYAIERRVATWWPSLERSALAAQTRGDRLSGARWAMSAAGLGMAPGLMLADTERAAAEGIATPGPLRIAARLESYERSPAAPKARVIATERLRLAAAGDAASAEVARAIDENYRNANLRVAVSADLIERLLPAPEPVVSPIRDRIAGAPVRGRSTTRTELQVRLVPDATTWRLGLEASGVVSSETYSRGGPAVLRSRGSTSFTAKKLIVVNNDGFRAAPAVARASGASRLTGLTTSYDRVPLIGSYVRSTARQEYARLRNRAASEMRVKVERQVSQTLDTRVTPALSRIERRFRDEVLGRTAALGLSIEPIEMRTTDTRLISRVRIAGAEQLAAHTPRMRAPSDSVLSLQLHESTLNNALEGLALAGERMTAAELRERLVERLDVEPETPADPAAEKAIIQFANEEPLRITFADGRAHLTMSIAEMVVRGGRHRHFRVHTYYKPSANGFEASLVQDGTPQIEGRMRTASRIRLHGVLGKVLGEDRRIPLVKIPADASESIAEAFTGLATNQLVIEDGWLGVAIGPARDSRIATQIGRYVR